MIAFGLVCVGYREIANGFIELVARSEITTDPGGVSSLSVSPCDHPSGAIFMRLPVGDRSVQGSTGKGITRTRWRGSYLSGGLAILSPSSVIARPKKASTASTSDKADYVNDFIYLALVSPLIDKGESDYGGSPLNTCGAAPIA